MAGLYDAGMTEASDMVAPSPAAPESAGAGRRLFLDLVLYPHRSLPLRGFWILIGGVSLLSFIAGMVCVSLGAWPVTGFFGLDVLLLAWFFRRNYRDARQYERIRLSQESLTVRRVNAAGQAQGWSFEPYWLRVEMDDPPQPQSQVTLASHGRRLTVASFLSPDERCDVARAIRNALYAWKARPAGID